MCVCVCVCVCTHLFSHVWLFVTPCTVALQVLLSMEFARQEYWSKLPSPIPGIFPIQGSNMSLLNILHWQGDSLPLCCLRSPAYSFGNTHKSTWCHFLHFFLSDSPSYFTLNTRNHIVMKFNLKSFLTYYYHSMTLQMLQRCRKASALLQKILWLFSKHNYKHFRAWLITLLMNIWLFHLYS